MFKETKKKEKVKKKQKKGGGGADECREFSLVNSASLTVWKNRTKIIGAFERNG